MVVGYSFPHNYSVNAVAFIAFIRLRPTSAWIKHLGSNTMPQPDTASDLYMVLYVLAFLTGYWLSGP